ncbi:O-antigen ligase family protein [Ancylobacter sp. VNQ12]|uniref:O-antigen ligase family protein n=1 Tax=Ancylobacter sp. VNQ12 TaxID=3400920 RepID=UPI003C0E5502
MSSRPARQPRRPASRQSTSKPQAVLRRAGWPETYNDVVFIGLLVAVAWVPLPFGSNLPNFWMLNAALFGGLLVLFELGVLVSSGRRPVAMRRLWLPLLLLGGIAAWILAQLSTWMPGAWESSFWTLARDVLVQMPDAAPVEGRISADPDNGVMGLIRLLTCAAAFYLALQLCRDRWRADLFALMLVLIAVGYALYGIVQLLAFPNTLVWIEKTAYLASVTSTFVNRNSYATYAGVGLVMTFGLLAELVQRSSFGAEVPWTYRVGALVDTFVRRGMPIFVAILVIGIALLWTGSRAGIVASFAGAIVFVILAATLGKRRLIALLLGALAILGIAGGIVAYGELFVQRLTNDGGSETRWYVVRAAFQAALDVPWTGFGYGSFDRVYAVYRDFGQDFILHWDKAHNTYVELLFELGIPAFVAFIILGGALLLQVVRNVYGRNMPSMLSLSALAASVVVFVHAFVDFSLQMQAIAITYWAILGAGLAQSWSRRIDTSI